MDFDEAIQALSPEIAEWHEAAQSVPPCPGGALCGCTDALEHYTGLVEGLSA